jgi:hypothetical protein
MSIPVHNSVDYQQPRWLLRTAAWGSALVYGCSFLVANIFPHGLQEHGWPLIYMVREWRVPGDFTILYGPWPIDDPPLIWFRPTCLLLNVLCGIVLTCLASVVSLYWLRVRRRPLQFSLRGLFGFTAVTACFLALFKCFNPDFGSCQNAVQIAWCALRCILLLSQVLVYTVPLACTATAAQRAVVLSAGSRRRSRWAGIHWLTWLVAALVSGATVHYSAFSHTWYAHVGSHKTIGSIMLASYGWPLTYRAQNNGCCGSDSALMEDGFPLAMFQPAGLLADAAVWLAIVAATGLIVERWVRRTERRTPMKPASILATAVVVGGVYCALKIDESFRPEWYDYPFWLFGIACTILAVEVAVFSAAGWLFRRFREWIR